MVNNSLTERRHDLDIAKGIGIILVVWAHANGPFTDRIGQFHMPLFFFISGMLFHDNGTILHYIKRKCSSLLIPFWKWNLLLFPLFYILYYWKQWSLQVLIIGIGEIILTVNKVPFLGATWFLPALFWTSIFWKLILKFAPNKKIFDLFALIFVGGGIAIVGFAVNFPYRISRTCVLSFFYIAGYLFQKYHMEWNYKIQMVLAGIAGVVFYIISGNNSVSMAENSYDNPFLFIIGAFCAIYFILTLSNGLAKVQVNFGVQHLMYLGKNSMCIVIWNFLAFRIAIIVQIIFWNADVRDIVAFPVYDTSGIWFYVYIVSGIYGSLLWEWIMKRLPFHLIFTGFSASRREVR